MDMGQYRNGKNFGWFKIPDNNENETVLESFGATPTKLVLN